MREKEKPMEKPDEVKKLTAIATDMQLDTKLRINAIDLLGNQRSREALLALLSLAANESLNIPDRDLALKRARDIIKSER